MQRSSAIWPVLLWFGLLGPVPSSASDPLKAESIVSYGDTFLVGNAEYESGLHQVIWNLTQWSGQASTPQSSMDRLTALQGWPVAVAVHPSGDVFVAGDTTTGFDYPWHMTVRKGRPGGGPWKTVDELNLDAGQYPTRDLVIDAIGNIYTAAVLTTYKPGQDHIYIRKSSDGGATWKQVGDFSGTDLDLTRLMLDSQGKLFAFCNDQKTWFVRRMSTAGSWETVDELALPWTKGRVTSEQIFQDASRRIWAVGYLQDFVTSSVPVYKHVRYSDAGGAPGSWKDLFPLAQSTTGMFQRSLGWWAISSGALFLTTSEGLPCPPTHYCSALYRSKDEGASWKKVATFNLGRYTKLVSLRERKDGVLYGLIQAGNGMFSDSKPYLALSRDQGATWSTAALPQP